MSNLGPSIDEAIAQEEQELLQTLSEEPGYFSQMSALFDSQGSWINYVLMTAQIMLFAIGAYAGWRFFGTTDALSALHWGLPAATLLLMSLMIKLALWPVVQANRILRAVKRVELRMVAGK